MNYYSFDNLKIDSTGHYDLFQKTTKNIGINDISLFYVTTEFEGRLDLICRFVHGNTDYLEEMMTINNMFNQYSVKAGTFVRYFTNANSYQMLYQSDAEPTDKKDDILLMNRNKSTKKDKNRIGSPPSIKPDNLIQVDVNHSKKKITIINKFK